MLIAGLVLLIAVFALVSYLRSRIDFDDLSVEQLTAGGYYAYILPDSYTDSLGWKRNITLGFGFDWQCHDFLSNDTWNPVEISYKDASGNPVFEAAVSETDALFEDSKATEVVSVNADWIPTHTGIAYPPSKGTWLKVHDSFGMDVVFSSWMKLDQLLNVISKLQYAGPSLQTVTNPWKRAC